MTSTFATQFTSGSPKGICGIMEEVRKRLKQGKVKQQTLDWLSNAVNTNGIFAKYKICMQSHA